MTHYETLEVSEKASPEAIKGAYKYLAQEWHPDHPKNAGRRTQAEERFKALSAAFDVLSDPDKRAIYDRKLREARAAQQPPPPPKPPPRPPPAPPPAQAAPPRRPPGTQKMRITPAPAAREGRSLGSRFRLLLVVAVSLWLAYQLLGSAPSVIEASTPARVGGYEPPAGAACVLLDSSGQKDLPNDAVISYKVRNKGNGAGTVTVSIELQTSRGKSVQQKEHRLDAGEERQNYIAFSLAGTDGRFRHFVRCTP